ncbi:hypothetical protein DdX_20770 [Ditylenchus destructor]|uniref:Uncharacterized protein n=1 Tax=Ditylenchus destructor TaxID=166010 RepID=A0AAD4QVV3_9BILA|nr:hypothetical protein DdX_20770 [Ditylenchus destructor]
MANFPLSLSFLFVSCIAAAISIKVQVHKLVRENNAWKSEPFDETYTLTLENKNDAAELERKVDILLKAHNEKKDPNVLDMFLAFDPSYRGIPQKYVRYRPAHTELLLWGNPPKVFVKMATEVKFTIDDDPTERSVYITANETWATIVFLHIAKELRIKESDIIEMRINDKNGKSVKSGYDDINTKGLKLWVKIIDKMASSALFVLTLLLISIASCEGENITVKVIKMKDDGIRETKVTNTYTFDTEKATQETIDDIFGSVGVTDHKDYRLTLFNPAGKFVIVIHSAVYLNKIENNSTIKVAKNGGKGFGKK